MLADSIVELFEISLLHKNFCSAFYEYFLEGNYFVTISFLTVSAQLFFLN